MAFVVCLMLYDSFLYLVGLPPLPVGASFSLLQYHFVLVPPWFSTVLLYMRRVRIFQVSCPLCTGFSGFPVAYLKVGPLSSLDHTFWGLPLLGASELPLSFVLCSCPSHLGCCPQQPQFRLCLPRRQFCWVFADPWGLGQPWRFLVSSQSTWNVVNLFQPDWSFSFWVFFQMVFPILLR